MLNLDPAKLLVIAVVAIILLGPDKLPQVARQVGGAWRSFNEFRHRMETEVRNTMPDLPSTTEIARLARSPSALLDHLSNMGPGETTTETEPGVDEVTGSDGGGDPAAGVIADDGVPSQNGSGAAANGTVAEAEGLEAATAGPTPSTSPAAPPVVASPEVTSTPPGPATNPRSSDVIVPADPSLN